MYLKLRPPHKPRSYMPLSCKEESVSYRMFLYLTIYLHHAKKAQASILFKVMNNTSAVHSSYLNQDFIVVARPYNINMSDKRRLSTPKQLFLMCILPDHTYTDNEGVLALEHGKAFHQRFNSIYPSVVQLVTFGLMTRIYTSRAFRIQFLQCSILVCTLSYAVFRMQPQSLYGGRPFQSAIKLWIDAYTQWCWIILVAYRQSVPGNLLV